MNILYVVSESFPFAKDGGLGDVAYALPQALTEIGHDVRVILPLYDTISNNFKDQMTLISNFTVDVAIQTLYCGLYFLQHQGVTYYFIENDIYFMRGRLYGCLDDDARFAFFSAAVCNSIKYMDWHPDIIHCNDWQTALVLFYLQDKKLKNHGYSSIRTVFTIHNVEYQGNFSYQILTDVFGLSGVLFSRGILELDGNVNLMKGAIEIADCVTTVSPSYALELTEHSGAGVLSQVLSYHKIFGIRNGIHKNHNPYTNPYVHRAYDVNSVTERIFNKLWLQENLGLKLDEDAPLLGCVSRLLPRKGFELLYQVMPKYLQRGVQFVVCGDGNSELKELLQELEEKFPNQVAIINYSEAIAVEVFSSIDIFLMPSMVEPCGTAQLQAMRYGAVPLVHATGGLRDTFIPYDSETKQGCGFVFEDYTSDAFCTALDCAISLYQDVYNWEHLEQNCMKQDFSWNEPAKAYSRLYESLLEH